MAWTLDQIRNAVTVWEDNSGRIRNTALVDEYNLTASAGEVKSLNPPQVEVLSGRVVRPQALIGPIPSIGEIVLVVRFAGLLVVFSGVQDI